MEHDNCPHCGSNQQGAPIPEEYLRKGSYGEWDGVTPRFYGRTICVEIRGVYDGGLFWQCPDCGGRWHRWPEGHYLRERAEQYVNPKE
jgi:hypothetical protein